MNRGEDKKYIRKEIKREKKDAAKGDSPSSFVSMQPCIYLETMRA